MTRLAVLYASVGTGHTSAAKALCSCWLAGRAKKAERAEEGLFFKDTLDYLPSWIRRSVTGSYLCMARRFPWLWHRLYEDTDSARGGIAGTFWRGLHGFVAGRYIGRLIADLDAFAPDAVVATHFMGMSALLEKWDADVPVYFVDTDFGTHALQRDPRFAGCFAAGEGSVMQHRADLLPNADLLVRDFGIPIAPAYSDPPSRYDARARLGVDPEAKMILLSGGGIGAGPLEEAADSMTRRQRWRVEIMCGNNAALRERLREKYYPFKQFVVNGFVDNMPDYYAACDIAIMKPGGLSTAEALASGTAMLLLDPLPGLERYNGDYLLMHGAAKTIHEKRLAGELVEVLLGSPASLGSMKLKARSIARPHAAENIIDSIIRDIERRS